MYIRETFPINQSMLNLPKNAFILLLHLIGFPYALPQIFVFPFLNESNALQPVN